MLSSFFFRLLFYFTVAFWGSCFPHLAAEETNSELQGGGGAVPRNWMGLSLNPHVVEFAVDIAGCRVCGVSTLDKKSFPPTPEVSFSSTPLEALYSKHLQAPLGAKPGVGSASAALARRWRRKWFVHFVGSRPRPGSTFSGRWRLCQCMRHQLEVFLSITAEGVALPGAGFRAGVGVRCRGRSWAAVWARTSQRRVDRGAPAARGPCDSGESGPERGFLLRSGPLVHFPRAPGHPPSPSP